MKLTLKYRDQLEKVSSGAIGELISGVEVLEVHEALESRTPGNWRGDVIVVGKDVSVRNGLGLLELGFQHIVQNSRGDFFYDLFASTLLIKNPERFCQNPLPFFIQNSGLHSGDGTLQSISFKFSSSTEKTALIADIDFFIAFNQRTKRMKERILLIADELIANALFNAPVDSAGVPLFKNLSRDKAIKYPEGCPSAEIFLVYDDRQILIGCRDPFGSVDRSLLLNRLVTAYSGDGSLAPYLLGGGSGLGSKMVIDNSSGYHVVVNKGVSSLFCASLPLAVGQKKLETMPKNIHYCFF